MKKLLFGVAALLASVAANASIIPTLSGEPVDAGDGTFLYTYTATLASDQAVLDGSYFTLYDVVGFDRFGSLGDGFTASSQLVGFTPSNVLPNDDNSILNVTFLYNGPSINFDGPLSERELGTFEVYATAGAYGFGDFTAEAVRNDGPTRGTLLANIGINAVGIPGGGDGNPSLVPEPASWAMMVFGFGLVGAGMRRRTRTPVVTG